jgi:hypothetical protein
MKILIKVTKDVLKATMMCGLDKSNHATGCAIAVACHDLFGKCAVTWRTSHVAEIVVYYDDYGYTEFDLPQAAAKFMVAFDELEDDPQKRLDLPETSFEVDVPNKVIERIGISEAYRILSESKTLELVMPK